MVKCRELDVRGTRSGRIWLDLSIRFCRWRARSAGLKAEGTFWMEPLYRYAYWKDVEQWWYGFVNTLENIRTSQEREYARLIKNAAIEKAEIENVANDPMPL
jgi:hypothetical protein